MVIQQYGTPESPVLAYTLRPRDLAFYLERPVDSLQPSEVVSEVCQNKQSIVFIVQPYMLPRVDVPCLPRRGVRHHRFRQYRRGGEINVWFVPAAAA